MKEDKKVRGWNNLLYSAWDIALISLDAQISTVRSKLSLSVQSCPYGKKFATSGLCSFKARTRDSIEIGNNVRLLAGWRSNRVGLKRMLLLQTFDEGQISIGDQSGCSSVVISSRSRISIGKHVNVGGNAVLIDHDFHALDPLERRLPANEQEASVRTSPIEIGDDVFIGTNSIILKGVSLGARSIVAAGSVVFKGEYPPDSLLQGNPATVVKRGGKIISAS